MATKYQGPADALAFYEALVAMHPDVDRKGAKNPYTSRNGHMFSFLDEGGAMSLRLPAPERSAFIEKYDTRLSEQYGTIMKEYVVVPPSLLEDTASLFEYFEQSYTWIGTLKPKPTKGK